MNIKRVVLSLAMIIFVGGIVASGTGAFFSDTETSEENIFTAGAVDLKVDSVAHINGLVCFDGEWIDEDLTEWDGAGDPPSLVLKADVDQADIDAAELAYNTDFPANFPKAGDPCEGTWTLTDLGLDDDTQVPSTKFFNYTDLKPGDNGENTISLHVINNDAYMCAIINNMEDTEMNDNCTEPESEDGDTTCDPTSDSDGEISQFLKFFTWADDGDNIWEEDEAVLFSNESGPASDVIDGRVYPLFVPGTTGAIAAEETEYIGMYWCFGDIIVDDTNFTLECDGEPVDNTPQTDMLTADIGFYVEQARNNDGFECTDELLEEDEARDITSEAGDTWASVVGSFDESWQADARWGDGGNDGEQNEIRIGDAGGASPIVQTHTDNSTGLWRSGEWEEFTFTYLGPDEASFEVGDESVTTDLGAEVVPSVGGPKLGLTLKVNVDDVILEVEDIELDGLVPAGPTSASVSASGDKAALVLSGDTELSDGFVLTGKVRATWTTEPTGTGGEQFSMLIQVD